MLTAWGAPKGSCEQPPKVGTQQSRCRRKGLQPGRPRAPGRLYLHDGTGRQDLLFDVGVAGRAAHRGEIAHGVLGGHRLAGSRLPADDDGLVLLVSGREKPRSGAGRGKALRPVPEPDQEQPRLRDKGKGQGRQSGSKTGVLKGLPNGPHPSL